jgi:hypothetical protein
MVKKIKEKIEHRIIEKTDWIMPIFYIILSWASIMIVSFLAYNTIYLETNNPQLGMTILIFVWIIWAWTIIKNKAWKPNKTKIIEHYIVSK